MATVIPTEAEEQRVVVEWLRLHKILHFHPANEGRHKPQYRKKLAALGLVSGVPDLFILDRPPLSPESPGVVIEMKRRAGGHVSESQDYWLQQLELRGWLARVCKGAADAIEYLQEWGYGR